MKNYSLMLFVVALSSLAIARTSSGRGFGGFHGGGFGGGGFGGFHGGGFGGGGFGGVHGGGFGGSGFGGDERLSGLSRPNYGGGGGFSGFDRQPSSYGQRFGGGFQSYAGGGGGGLNSFDRGLNSMPHNFGGESFRSTGQSGQATRFEDVGKNLSDTQLNSFLGLPTDMGMHQAGGFDHAYAGSARGLTSYNGAAAGERGASGHEWTGPNGTTIAHGSAGERGGVVGPNGAAGGERGASGTVVKGPNGTTIAHGSAEERGGAVGPNGAAAGERGASGTIAKGPNGTTVAHGSAEQRGAVVGPNGAAGGSRTISGTAVRGPNGTVVAHGSAVTRNWSAADMRVQGNYVRNNFHDYGVFNGNWYNHYPHAWWGAFAAGPYSSATWESLADWLWLGQIGQPIDYGYGDNVTYVDNNVYLNDQPIATAADYDQSAANLAQVGEQANIPSTAPSGNNQVNATNAKWLPLGVFEALRENEKTSNMMFQLAVNKDGIVRGNYFDTADKNVQPIEGSVDKKTQRIAWVVEDRKSIVFDTGIYNLTKEETPVLAHMGKDKTEQWLLVRLKPKHR